MFLLGLSNRATWWICEKAALDVAQPIFVKSNSSRFPWEKVPQNLGYS
jgi:hypothetical protein